jgi:hypothetical protein
VILHTLVSDGGEMTVPQIAVACERDPNELADRSEVETAVQILVEDDLARCVDERFRATRAAIRAAKLSF